ncbi:MAG: thioesterase family protein [Pedobacter sp.]|nr:thioesterase family protein [Pedobacter sp.]
MSLDALFAALRTGESVDIPPGWTQGRANYGGLVGALMYARTQSLFAQTPFLRSATVSFVGPVATGPATVTAEILRGGKSVTQTEARILQNGEVVALLLCSFGTARESYISVPAQPAPVFKSPDECQALPYVAGMTPEFTQHFDFRWGHGDFPFTGSALPELGGWMRLKEGRAGVDMLDLFMLVDAWPPAILPMVKGVAPGSSMTWTLEPIHLPEGKTSSSWWQYQAVTEFAQNGYGNCAAKIWDDEGRLVAISRQTVVVFA